MRSAIHRETWTYTKGIISQVRLGYEWQPDPSGTKHVADVIQTQTPISPGNSGGPLISDGGRLIGVNSFKKDGEALNFAVSVGEVEKFLTAAQGGAFEPKLAAATSKPCEVKVMYEGRTQKDDAFIRNVDLDCSGQANATLYVPDDKTKPIVFRIDTNHDGATRGDLRRGSRRQVGLFPVGYRLRRQARSDRLPSRQLAKPSRYEKYQPKS
jgi:hypothetical protein